MTTSTHLSTVSARHFFVAAVIASSIVTLALPGLTHAATYAYVNQAGEVNAVTANDWMTAIATAVNIHIHSGVLLLTNQNDPILNTSIF